MVSPGAKGWIVKYFDLVDKGQIELVIDRPAGLRKLHFMHLVLGESGIIFGHPVQLIFAQNIEHTKWTQEEKLKLLLFESHLFVYLQIHISEPFNKGNFLKTLDEFYAYHNAAAIKKLLTFWSKENMEDRIEKVLKSRVDIKTNLFENKWWVNSLSNAFVFLDIILYDDFVHWEQEGALNNYNTYAQNALNAIILSIYSDGFIDDRERKIFDVYLASANLEERDRTDLKERFASGSSMNEFSSFIKDHWLMRRFLFDLSAMNIFYQGEPVKEETDFLTNFSEFLSLTEEEVDESLAMIEKFVLQTKDAGLYLDDSTSYEKVYSSLSARWTKVLWRNKDKLAKELSESKELIKLVKKSSTEELTQEEKDQVKSQFKDIARSIPALAIFMVPGGTLLLPLVLKIVPDLVPSSFRDNTLDEEPMPPSKEIE